MNNGMTFGMEGPVVTGWWTNPKTGDSFKVVDTFFEDNKLLVKTEDGRLLNYNQIQNYIQTDDQKTRESMIKRAKNQSSTQEIPKYITDELEGVTKTTPDNDLIIPDDDIYGGKPTLTVNADFVKSDTLQISDYSIIDRALNRKTFPNVKGNIEWDDFPMKEIEMLVDVMGVSIDDVIQYYISHLDINDIKKSIEDVIKEHINSKFSGESPTTPTTKKTNKKKE